jgi:pilus assembly protein FimV
MHVNKRPVTVSFALKTLTCAVSTALLMTSVAHGAGLGKLTVLSSLGQPLRAEIELTSVSNDEAGGLVAKLAPVEAFRTANIDFNPALMSLRFAVEQRNGRQLIRVTSSQPVNEPFVDMLLELSWNGGKLVREYTFLLDPADLRQTQSAQVAAPVDVGGSTSRASAAPAAPSASAAPAAPARAPANSSTPNAASRVNAPSTPAPVAEPKPAREAGEEYRVKSGDTLGKIAGQMKPTEVSLDMMLVALYRANPDAFIGNNMNRLRAGRILNLPSTDTVRGTSDAEAKSLVVAHAADFAAYRNKLAGQVGRSAPSKAPDAGQSATGKISAKVEERATPANEAKDRLKLSKANPAAATAGKTAEAGVEDKIAKQQQAADAAARVKELEKNVNDLEKLMAVKSKTMQEQAKSAASASAPAGKTAAAPAPAATPAPAAATPAPAAAPVPTPTPATPAADAAAAKVPDLTESAAPPAKPKPKPAVLKPVTPSPIEEPGVFDTLMDNMASVGIALVALLGGAGLLIARRRKKMEELAMPATEMGDPGTQAHSLFARTGGQSVDTSNSVFNSNFAPSASQLDTNEVDPIAEADVYIAYGRDVQAEEILKEALRMHPERQSVRLKLLEIYATRKDIRSFETHAGELFSISRGESEEWRQAAALGQSVDPNNPLYANAGAPADADQFHSVAPAAAAMASAAALSSFDPYQEAPKEAAHDAKAEAEERSMDFSLDEVVTPAVSYNAVQAAATHNYETAVPAPANADDDADHFLDFDLGGITADQTAVPAPAPAAAPAPTAAPAAEPAADLAFDSPFAVPVTPSVEKREAAPVDEAPLDFGMDFDLDPPPALGKQAPEAAPAPQHDLAAEAGNFDLHDIEAIAPTEDIAAAPPPAGDAPEFDNLDDLNFDLPQAATPAEPASAAAEAAVAKQEEDYFATAAPAAAAPSPASPAASEAAAPEFDLSGIDLDLDSNEPAAPAAAVGGVDDPLSAVHLEMDTKLDLAVAYQEIGDKEGARELIDEVIKGGSDAQVAKAQAMRASLG